MNAFLIVSKCSLNTFHAINRIIPLYDILSIFILSLLASIYLEPWYSLLFFCDFIVIWICFLRISFTLFFIISKEFKKASILFFRSTLALAVIYPCFIYSDQIHLLIFLPSYLPTFLNSDSPEFDWGTGKSFCGSIHRTVVYYPGLPKEKHGLFIRSQLLGHYYLETSGSVTGCLY